MSVSNGFYFHQNSSGQSITPSPLFLKDDLKKSSSSVDLAELQGQLNTQKKLQEGAYKLLQTTENDILSGKYNKDPKKRKSKKLEAQIELNNVNRQIMILERKIEAAKRIQAQENNNNTNNSYSYIKNTINNNKLLTEDLIPPNNIHNITFNSAHTSLNSTPLLDEFQQQQPQQFMDDQDNVFSSTFDESQPNSQTSPSQGTSSWFLSELLQSLGQKNEHEEFYIDKANQVVDLLKNNPDISNNLVFSTLGHRIQFLLMSESKEVIACGYRIARYVINDIASLRMIRSLRIHYFLIQSLSKNTTFTVEREQAIKLIRRYIDIENGHKELSIGVVKSLAMIVMSGDDEFKDLVTETLCELFLLNSKLLFESNGIKPIIKIMNEGPLEISVLCGQILIKVLDYPDSRKYLRNGEELGVIINYFVNNFSRLNGDEINDKKSNINMKIFLNIEKLHNSAFIISSFLKTWVGLLGFSINKFDFLKTLICSLSFDIPILRDILMDIFFDVLKIRALPWLNQNNQGTNRRSSQIFTGLANNTISNVICNEHKTLSIVNHYTAVLLRIFLDCGLIEQVFQISQTSTDDLNRKKSMLLLIEIMNLSVNLLPQNYWIKIFENPKLFNFLNSNNESVYQVDKHIRKFYKNRTTFNISNNIFNSYSNYSQNLSMIISSNIDDIQFKKMIDDTRVLITKKFSDWKWDIIIEIFKGPLRIPKKFEDCLKYQFKFIKRLMSFYRPFKTKFMRISKTKNNTKICQKFIMTGVEMFNTFLSHSEGIKFLSENKLLPQIAECLAQVDPISGLYAENPIFSKVNLTNTLSFGYFKMLGTLSNSIIGLKLLQKWKIFSILQHIIHERGREDLIMTFLPEFNYDLPSQLRIIFSHCLTSCDTNVRNFATKHLGVILLENSFSTQDWAIKLLINQLYDTDMEVCNIAVQILDNYCINSNNIAEVLKFNPSIDHLDNIGSPLLLRFLSTSVGYDFLSNLDFIETEMLNWCNYKNKLYVLTIEELLSKEYNPFNYDYNNEETGPIHNKKKIPHHFYGELVKTSKGLQILQSSNHLQIFIGIINSSISNFSFDQVLELKSALWAVGHIGLSDLAIPIIEDSGIIESVISLCKICPIWSVKGTAFFVLGLLSSSNQGLEILDEYGWDVAIDANNNPTTFCLPNDTSEYFNVESNDLIDILDKNVSFKDGEDVHLINSIDLKIIQLIANFNMTPTNSTKQLTKLRLKYKECFNNPDLYLKAMFIIENYSYKLSARNFILELFSDKKALENVIRRDRSKMKRSQSNHYLV